MFSLRMEACTKVLVRSKPNIDFALAASSPAQSKASLRFLVLINEASKEEVVGSGLEGQALSKR